MSLAARVRSGRRDTPGTLAPTCHDLPLSSRTSTSVLAWSKAVVDLRGSKASLIGCSCLRCWTTFRITNLAAANPHSILIRGEHRLFCRITQTWRGRPLTDHATIIDLIAATSTKTGLKVESALDTRIYEKGIRVTKAEMERLDIRGDAFHPEWNYSVVPQQPKS